MITKEQPARVNNPISGPLDSRHVKRIAVYGGPKERRHSAKLLGDATAKLSRVQRKLLLRSRDYRLDITPDEPIHPAVKLAVRLSRLPLRKLIRRQRQFARRASTSIHRLKSITLPLFRAPFEAERDRALGSFKQVTAEIHARQLACEGNLK